MFSPNALSYSLISGKWSRTAKDRKARASVFELWEPFWKEVYRSAGSDYTPKADDLLRQDVVHILNYENRPIGLLFSSLYDLACPVTQQHSYMKFYSSDFFSYLNDQGLSQIMTYEYLTLLPEFRRSVTECGLAAVIFRLAYEFWRSTPARSLIVTARNDVKVNDRLRDLGLHVVKPATKQRNFECDLMAHRSEDFREIADTRDREIFQRLWHARYQSPELDHLLGTKETTAHAA